ncbi:energy transducer TonB [Arenimonas sp.]|uniref:energy transducer TonB n=1 Tax=Arenimonas sp. TaxID=1872635 RepID=UPI0039E2377B
MSPHRPSSKYLPLAIVLALGLGLAGCGGDKADTTAKPAAPAGPTAEEVAAKQAAAQQAAALAALTPEELKKRGNEALREQRLYAPAGDNAMEYFIALRKKTEKPDASAESALIDLQPYAVIAAEQAIGREDFVEAERLRGLIESADAQAPALPRIADAIAKGKVAAANRVTEEAARAEQQAKAAEEAKTRAAEQAAAAAAAARTAAQPAAPAPQPAAPQPTRSEPPPQPVAAQPQPAAPQPTAAAPARPSGGLVPISTPQPAYPPEARRAGASGEVTVSFTVNTDGSVSDVELVSAKPRGVFDRSVQGAVRRWRFQPTDSAQTVTRTFTFRP